MSNRIQSFAVTTLICVAAIAGTASAVDRLETEAQRSRAQSLQSFDRSTLEDKAHYSRTWVNYCAKNPARGGCDTVLRRLERAKPQAESFSDAHRDPSVHIDDAKR